MKSGAHCPSLWILIAGLPGSGKSAAARHIAYRLGCRVVSAGDVFRRMSEAHGLPVDRRTLQRLGESFLRKEGEVALAKLLISEGRDAHCVVIEGIRPPETVRHIKQSLPRVVVVYIESSEGKRLSRLAERGAGLEEWKAILNEPLEHRALGIRDLADIVITNDGAYEDYLGTLDELVSGIINDLQ